MELIATCKRIILRSQYEVVDGVMIDLQTANAIVTVADALSDESRAKLDAMSPERAGEIAWKLVSR